MNKTAKPAAAAEKKPRISRRKRAKYTSYLVVSIAVVLVCVIGLNVIVGLLSDRFNLELDFTGNSRFSLSKESEDFVRDVRIPVNVYLLNSRPEWEKASSSEQILSMIRKYASINRNIKLNFIDLDTNPTFKNKYPKLTLNPFDVIFESDYRYYKIDQQKLAGYFNVDSYYYNKGKITFSSDAENLLTGALVNVCSKTQPIAYFLTGNGEDEKANAAFTELLSMNSFSVKTVNLLTGDLPTLNKDDHPVDFLILSAPASDFTDAQLKKIDAFLRNNGEYGKHLIYFASPLSPELPNLNAYLKEWGISVEKNIVAETDTAYVNQAAGFSLLKYNTEDEKVAGFTGDFASKMKYPATLPTQLIKPAFDKKEFITTHTLLSFSKGKLFHADENGKQIPLDEEPAPHAAAILAEKVFIDTEGYEKPASNVVVFGSPLQEANLLSASTFSNEEYLINTLNTLIHKEETVHISSKTLSQNELSMTGIAQPVILVLFILVIPMALLAAGLIIWLRRKKL